MSDGGSQLFKRDDLALYLCDDGTYWPCVILTMDTDQLHGLTWLWKDFKEDKIGGVVLVNVRRLYWIGRLGDFGLNLPILERVQSYLREKEG